MFKTKGGPTEKGKSKIRTDSLPLFVNLIGKKTWAVTFVLWAILITDIVFGTFYDAMSAFLNSQAGVILFIAMSITAFTAGLYVLRDYMRALRDDLQNSSFFNKVYRATPIFLYGILAVFAVIIIQMLLFGEYSAYLLIPVVMISGIVAVTFFGFRTFKFLSWHKSSRRNIMILAFAVSSLLFATSATTTTFLDTKILLQKPNTIGGEYRATNNLPSTLSPAENMVFLYGYVLPVVLTIPAETVAVAFFLRYFKDKIGRAKFWTIVILPPLLLLFGVFAPQIVRTSADEFQYINAEFIIFRVIGTAGWIVADFVIAFAYLLVSRTFRQINSNNKMVNYLLITAVSTILVSPTANDWINNTFYPPFGAIQRAFLVLSSFLFSIGIYSVALSVSRDAKLRQFARKYVREYVLFDTLGNAEMEVEIEKRLVKLMRTQAHSMATEAEREVAGGSQMTEIEIRRYLDMAIEDIKKAKQQDNATNATRDYK